MTNFIPTLVSFFTNWKLRLVQLGVLLTFGLTPFWYRVSVSQLPHPLYTTRFVMFLVMWVTVLLWVAFRLPGFADLRRDGLRRAWALAILLLALWAWASNLWAFQRVDYPEVGQSAALQLAMVAVFAVMVACVGPSAQAIASVLAASALFNGVVALLQVAAQGSIGLDVLGEFALSAEFAGMSVLQAGDVRWLRPYGLLPHPNILGGVLAVGLLAAVAWLLSRRGWLRWLGTLVFVVGWWGLLLTFSRGAWIGFAAGVFVTYPLVRRRALRRRSPRRHLTGTVGVALLLGIIFAATYYPLIAVRTGATTANTEMRSVSDRLVFLNFANRSIEERPLLGVGVGNFPWRTSYFLLETNFDLRGDNVHHVLLSAWTELGVVGLALTVAALALGTEAVLQAKPSAAQASLLGGVVALTVVGLLDHYPWTLLQTQTLWWALLAAAGRVDNDA